MFFGNNTVLVVFIVGILLLIIGVGFRDRNPGMILLGSGLLITLYAVVQKAIELFTN